MAPSDRYLTLLTSLPAHGPLFGATQTPLSRIRLEMRLRWLEPQDADDLAMLETLIAWKDQRFEIDDEAVVRQAEQGVTAINNDFARDLASWRLEMRTLVAALRLRHAGGAAPSERRRWGYGRWVPVIRRYWGEPHFRLERVFPWLPEAKRLLERGDALGLERLLLGTVWTHLERISADHYFDFEALVTYVTCWDLVARWTRYDADAALSRFDRLVGEGLRGEW
ncbi:MAG: hypothetical protein C1943_15180 [Halochromatium sp.]|nr:hypothetical protein [Halochromatium sp.]